MTRTTSPIDWLFSARLETIDSMPLKESWMRCMPSTVSRTAETPWPALRAVSSES
jgi:hypothetical protein